MTCFKFAISNVRTRFNTTNDLVVLEGKWLTCKMGEREILNDQN